MTPGDPVTPMTPGDPVTHAQGGAAQQDVRGMQDVGRMQAAVIGHVPPVAQLQRPREAQQHREGDGEPPRQPTLLWGAMGGSRGGLWGGLWGGYGGIWGGIWGGGVGWGGGGGGHSVGSGWVFCVWFGVSVGSHSHFGVRVPTLGSPWRSMPSLGSLWGSHSHFGVRVPTLGSP